MLAEHGSDHEFVPLAGKHGYRDGRSTGVSLRESGVGIFEHGSMENLVDDAGARLRRRPADVELSGTDRGNIDTNCARL